MSKLTDVKILLLTVLSLMASCAKEAQAPSPSPEVQTVHYKAAFRTDAGTKATLGSGMAYEFEVGDRVYVESTDGSLYGFLSLSSDSDAGNHEALFEGALSYEGEGSVQNLNPEITLVLVSGTDNLHSITGGKVGAVSGNSYGEDAWAPSLEQAVSRLSHFTGSGHLKDNSFTLAQQSSFLKCFVKMKSDDAPVDRQMTAKLVNNSSTLLREAEITVSEAGSLPFVFAFLGGNVSLENAKLVIEWKDSGNTDQSKNFDVSNQTLAANTYYTISRSMLSFDGFRITAISNGTVITFNWDGIEYSLDYGETWTPYSSPFTLNADDVACIKGNRTDYKNEKPNDTWWIPADKPIFRSTNKCYISGNIMSLLADDTALSESAFQGAFSRGSTQLTYIDIHPDAPLILPVTDMAPQCYMQMFRNCTSLTRAPQFRVESTAFRCCYNMFRQCSNLTDVSGIELPAMTLSQDCYRELFRECSQLTGAAPMLPAPTLVQECYRQMFAKSKITSIVCLATNISATDALNNWMADVPNSKTSTFYKASSMTSWPRSTSGIPSNWKVENYTGE